MTLISQENKRGRLACHKCGGRVCCFSGICHGCRINKSNIRHDMIQMKEYINNNRSIQLTDLDGKDKQIKLQDIFSIERWSIKEYKSGRNSLKSVSEIKNNINIKSVIVTFEYDDNDNQISFFVKETLDEISNKIIKAYLNER